MFWIDPPALHDALVGRDRYALMTALSACVAEVLAEQGGKMPQLKPTHRQGIRGVGGLTIFLNHVIPDPLAFVIWGLCGYYRPQNYTSLAHLYLERLHDPRNLGEDEPAPGHPEIVIDWHIDLEKNFCVTFRTLGSKDQLGRPEEDYDGFYGRFRRRWPWEYPQDKAVIAVWNGTLLPPPDLVAIAYPDVVTTKAEIVARFGAVSRQPPAERLDLAGAQAFAVQLAGCAPDDVRATLLLELQGGINHFFQADG
jgi:hypothetical protein